MITDFQGALLIADHLTASRRGKAIFSDISFVLLPGCILSVRGRNGSGKTTLLKAISGILETDLSGKVEVVHNNQDELEKNELFACCWQENGIKDHLTVGEHLQLWSSWTGCLEKVYSVEKYMNLDKISNVRSCFLSTGEKKRLSLARLMFSDALVWIIDEPFANLDMHSATLTWSVISAHCNCGGIVVYSDNSVMPCSKVFMDELVINPSGYLFVDLFS